MWSSLFKWKPKNKSAMHLVDDPKIIDEALSWIAAKKTTKVYLIYSKIDTRNYLSRLFLEKEEVF